MVAAFKYFGRLLSQEDENARAIRANLVKAHHVWARVGQVLQSKNASPHVAGKFYRAIVQSVLLYGSES